MHASFCVSILFLQRLRTELHQFFMSHAQITTSAIFLAEIFKFSFSPLFTVILIVEFLIIIIKRH